MKRWITTIGLLGLGLFILLQLITVIPDRALTATRMHVTKRRILQFCHQADSIPQSLQSLPKVDGFDNSIKDAWGRELIYTVADGQVELRSNGADRRLGGDADNRDIIQRFPLKDSDGEWSDELVDWSFDTFRETTQAQVPE